MKDLIIIFTGFKIRSNLKKTRTGRFFNDNWKNRAIIPYLFCRISMLEFQDSRSTLISYVIPSNMAVMSFVISFFIGEIEIILKNSNYNTHKNILPLDQTRISSYITICIYNLCRFWRQYEREGDRKIEKRKRSRRGEERRGYQAQCFICQRHLKS